MKKRSFWILPVKPNVWNAPTRYKIKAKKNCSSQLGYKVTWGHEKAFCWLSVYPAKDF
jgi:hypothetical protein